MPNVIMPKMGDAMEEGTLLRWLKQVGDEIAVGDPLAEIETDKVSLEIEATEAGMLSKTYVEEGATVPIGTPIAAIGEESADVAASAQPTEAAEAPPRRNQRQQQKPEPVAAAAGGANGRAAADVRPPAPSQAARGGGAAAGERLRASPLVKRLAAEHGIDLSSVTGTGPGGRIVATTSPRCSPARPARRPLLRHRALRSARAARSSGRCTGGANAGPSGRPARRSPRAAARSAARPASRMAESKAAAPHFYVTSEVDMAPAAALREQINAQAAGRRGQGLLQRPHHQGRRPGAARVPESQRRPGGRQLVDHPNIDVNVAVAIEGGLIAPVRPRRRPEESRHHRPHDERPDRPRSRRRAAARTSTRAAPSPSPTWACSTSASSSPSSTRRRRPSWPSARSQDVPVVEDGEIVPGKRMNITLSADHRVTDGAEVARFLQAVKRYLENPLTIAFA